MKAFFKFIAVIVGVVVLAGAGLAVFVLARTGGFRTVENVNTGSCRAVDLAGQSAEDIIVDRARGEAFYSALDRRGGVEGRPQPGTVKVFDLADSAAVPRPALSSEPPTFKPHGMSLFAGPDGAQTLFVINHLPDGTHAIEIFERGAEGGLFAHIDTVRGPELFAPNDVAAVGPREFYVANDTGARNGLQRAAEQIFGSGYSTLVHYLDGKLQVVAANLAAPGGVNAAADGARVFVAETQGQRVLIFNRDRVTGALELSAAVDIEGLPDNIDIAPDGAAWVTAHGSAAGLVRHFIDAANPAPSLVHRLALDDRGFWRAEAKYSSDGRNLSAGSVAVPVDGNLVLGSITERKALICALP
ncbi:MAG: hypothetical protein SFV21_03360 [Rhodospirillaceae bacterium]|nr:hypothetical protein [Rhodospirillaceae bacterium]